MTPDTFLCVTEKCENSRYRLDFYRYKATLFSSRIVRYRCVRESIDNYELFNWR